MEIKFIKDYGFCPATLGGYSADIQSGGVYFRIYGISSSLDEVFFSYGKPSSPKFLTKSWELEEENPQLFEEYQKIIFEAIDRFKLKDKAIVLKKTEDYIYSKSKLVFNKMLDSFVVDSIESYNEYRKISDQIDLIIKEVRETCILKEEYKKYLDEIV